MGFFTLIACFSNRGGGQGTRGTEAGNLVRTVREGQNRETEMEKKKPPLFCNTSFDLPNLLTRVSVVQHKTKKKEKCHDACKVDRHRW